MSDLLPVMLKSAENAGIAALLIWAAWKLLDKWAGRFLEAQQDQASGMKDLAAAVREGQGEQREVLLAIRAMAGSVERQTRWLEEIDGRLQSLPCETKGRC